jgi:molecular chaperone DnaK (HSP70)
VGAPKYGEVVPRLQAEAETAKLRLNSSTVTNVFILHLCNDDFGRPVDFQCELTRDDLDRLVSPLRQSVMVALRTALKCAAFFASTLSVRPPRFLQILIGTELGAHCRAGVADAA